ncbi:TetR/AcrR family transcriptional regulator [Cytobacillus horneckiae]|uniref:TetR/AcrR family transcriptional regulator n=1 Tax=Cytobacillus horneckiae TaxID=549687 RepID=A0A2N0ZI13_9BACI|nr:TetR/AcrR family transcriptional regulator [Cytobacillus horneckiae]MEC1157950.1 TetR/AcrR family transcriptional regulator [Cytobacillus horneckiae]MED2937125.1 TetR/AcrR family transcriptional regulator [Cytobacillus horneckiae]PKG29131.1 TetR/AcrR family transcriptional regulator [Cytobacillus horneckiae]
MAESFIVEARREQIINACIDTLEEVGYVKVSLTKIARKAKISTGLISYHFSDKADLINHTLIYLLSNQLDYISERVVGKNTATEQLQAFIEASIIYQETHYKNNIALIEIIFNAQTSDETPYYRITDEEEEDHLYMLLKDILLEGKNKQEFTQVFNADAVATIIQGAISESMLKDLSKVDYNYSHELIKMLMSMIK